MRTFRALSRNALTLPVRVLNGPGVSVDRSLLETWLATWSSELRLSTELVECQDLAALVSEIRRSESEHALLVNPGTLRGDERLRSVVTSLDGLCCWVDLLDANDRSHPVFAPTELRILGRGIASYRWALRRLVQHGASPPIALSYGEHREQIGDLRIPAGPGPHPVAMLIHGGSWQEAWERDTIEPLAIDLVARGYVTWNIEYRRVGASGGGWPSTCIDVALALKALGDLSDRYALDLERLAIIGHSAGGHLALWSVQQKGIPDEARSGIVPRLVVSLAGIVDLAEFARRGLGDGGNIVGAFMGAPWCEDPETYAVASPAESLPLGVPQLLVQGTADAFADLVDVNRVYARLATNAGDTVELLEFEGATHFDVIDPRSQAWNSTAERVRLFVTSPTSTRGSMLTPEP